MFTTSCKTTYDWLIKIQEKRRQIDENIKELNNLHAQAKINIAKVHGYPLEGDVVTHKGVELKLDCLSKNHFYLSSNTSYSKLIPRKLNGEWSKKSSGISLTSIEGVPSSHEYGVSWLINLDEEICYKEEEN